MTDRPRSTDYEYDAYMDKIGGAGAELGMNGYDEGEDEDHISQEDCWEVIRSFFEEKGLVRQQLDSFNEFLSNTMQELVEEVKSLTLEQSDQHSGHATDKTVRATRSTVAWRMQFAAWMGGLEKK